MISYSRKSDSASITRRVPSNSLPILLGNPRGQIKDTNEAPKIQSLFAHDRSLADETLSRTSLVTLPQFRDVPLLFALISNKK
jgi:hypothetical protein